MGMKVLVATMKITLSTVMTMATEVAMMEMRVPVKVVGV